MPSQYSSKKEGTPKEPTQRRLKAWYGGNVNIPPAPENLWNDPIETARLRERQENALRPTFSEERVRSLLADTSYAQALVLDMPHEAADGLLHTTSLAGEVAEWVLEANESEEAARLGLLQAVLEHGFAWHALGGEQQRTVPGRILIWLYRKSALSNPPPTHLVSQCTQRAFCVFQVLERYGFCLNEPSPDALGGSWVQEMDRLRLFGLKRCFSQREAQAAGEQLDQVLPNARLTVTKPRI